MIRGNLRGRTTVIELAKLGRPSWLLTEQLPSDAPEILAQAHSLQEHTQNAGNTMRRSTVITLLASGLPMWQMEAESERPVAERAQHCCPSHDAVPIYAT